MSQSARIRARDPNTSPAELAELVDDEDGGVRYWVARNPNTPAPALTQLADDEDRDVRKGVAENTNTPAPALTQLADDEDRDVRYWVALNPNTPAEVLTQLADDDDWDVRIGVAENPSASLETLLFLQEDRGLTIGCEHLKAALVRDITPDTSAESRRQTLRWIVTSEHHHHLEDTAPFATAPEPCAAVAWVVTQTDYEWLDDPVPPGVYRLLLSQRATEELPRAFWTSAVRALLDYGADENLEADAAWLVGHLDGGVAPDVAGWVLLKMESFGPEASVSKRLLQDDRTVLTLRRDQALRAGVHFPEWRQQEWWLSKRFGVTDLELDLIHSLAETDLTWSELVVTVEATLGGSEPPVIGGEHLIACKVKWETKNTNMCTTSHLSTRPPPSPPRK